ncbi:DUF7662 domain-containing protein [Lysinibacillus piscis]|nr:hypothetical protein [Lysinibacillus sp. KH24]
MSKYRPFFDYFNNRNDETIRLSFDDIEKILSTELPDSATNHDAWWANGGHYYSNFWLDAGYKVDEFELGEYVIFKKM